MQLSAAYRTQRYDTIQPNQCSYLQRIALKGTTQTNQISAVICSVSHSKVRHKPTKSVQLSAAYRTQRQETNQPNQCSYLQRIALKGTTQINQISAVICSVSHSKVRHKPTKSVQLSAAYRTQRYDTNQPNQCSYLQRIALKGTTQTNQISAVICSVSHSKLRHKPTKSVQLSAAYRTQRYDTNQLNQCSYLQRIALKGTTQTNQISAVICSVSHSKLRHKPTKSVQLSAAYRTQSYDTNQPNQCSYLQRIALKGTTQTNQISAVIWSVSHSEVQHKPTKSVQIYAAYPTQRQDTNQPNQCSYLQRIALKGTTQSNQISAVICNVSHSKVRHKPTKTVQLSAAYHTQRYDTNQPNQCSYLQRIALQGTTQTNQISAVICSVSHSKVGHKPTKSVQLSAAYRTRRYDTNQPNQSSYLQRIAHKGTTQTNQNSSVICSVSHSKV